VEPHPFAVRSYVSGPGTPRRRPAEPPIHRTGCVVEETPCFWKELERLNVLAGQKKRVGVPSYQEPGRPGGDIGPGCCAIEKKETRRRRPSRPPKH